MYQTAAAANKEGKKDPETTKETVAHPFLVLSVINYLANITEILSAESHSRKIETTNCQLHQIKNLNIGMSFHKHNPLSRNQAHN